MSSLVPLPIQYADFACWQRNHLQGKFLDQQVAYWRETLVGAEPLELPLDHARPALPSFRGEIQASKITGPRLSGLKALSPQENVTLFMTLLAAFNVLLHRYSGSTDVVVGSPTANRSRPELENLVGFFVNMLPMRTDLTGNPTFRQLLTRVRQTATEAYAHEMLPFEKLIDELQLPRNLGRNSLFDVTFQLLSAGDAPLSLGSMRGTCQRTRFDLECHLNEFADSLDMIFVYRSDLFEHGTIERMLDHFENLLETVSQNPDCTISDLPLMSESEASGIQSWSRPLKKASTNTSLVHQRFEQHAQQTPDAIAVQQDGRRITYRELDRWANHIAGQLRAHETAGAMVGLVAERSIELIAGMLGILKAGKAYVPLDPELPAQRLAFMIDDLQLPLVLCQRYLRDRLPTFNGVALDLDRNDDASDEFSESTTPNTASLRGLAYVIFTSGSTGRPKAVQIEHGSLLNLVDWHLAEYSIKASDRATMVASPGFDASVWEVWPYLTAGASVHIPGVETLTSPTQLIQWMCASEITVSFLPTPLAEVVVLLDWPATTALRALLTGGDKLHRGPGRQLPFRFFNHYGPTENTVVTSWCEVAPVSDSGDSESPPIGRPLPNVETFVVDRQMNLVPIGVPGELYIGGASLARGYYGRDALTREKFVHNPFANDRESRLYRTGDLCSWRPDGQLEFLGRTDTQVKLRGYRIELGEVESVLGEHPSVREAVAILRQDSAEDQRLVAYAVLSSGAQLTGDVLREFLKARLPSYMVPAAIVVLDALPLNSSGKIDRAALPTPGREVQNAFIAPRNRIEKQVTSIWQQVLKLDQVGVRDNFFDLGGNSLLLIKVHAAITERLPEILPGKLAVVDLFRYPTVESLARFLGGDEESTSVLRAARDRVRRREQTFSGNGSIAVVGMAGRFPGARDLGEFWANLRNGIESIRFFTDEELRTAGVDERWLKDPRFVKAKGMLDDVELFDAALFGFSPREAEQTDPQQRLFLETAWQTLEQAGYDPQRYAGSIGVYAGCSTNAYLDFVRSQRSSGIQGIVANVRDFLATRISYKLNLRGPSMTVLTACSTSLVAVHQACRSLLDFECDMALAGGVTVGVPVKNGYLFDPGGIMSPDGHCRAFDARAEGIVGGDGVGVVLLKRLDEALADGDTIRAIIRGSAVNNDGSLKAGYTAPSIQGQAEVIALAQAAGDVDAATISYIETHGTGTALGDPIEISALKRVFGESAAAQHSCALGALKTNVGHLDAAAGIAGLIKTVLCLEHRELVPTVHFQQPNLALEIDRGPFYVSSQCEPWIARPGIPLRAGVSSFGIGGTNAHAVLEEAPEFAPTSGSRPCQLLFMSANTHSALDATTQQLAKYLSAHPELDLADVAYSLMVGRRELDHRRMIVCRDQSDAVRSLETLQTEQTFTGAQTASRRAIAFVFPGQGAQHVNMGRDLYDVEPVFRDMVDHGCQLLVPHLNLDLRELLFPLHDQDAGATARLQETQFAQPALFVIEYALAQLWMSWGIRPQFMMGHSIGEYVAACLAGVFSLEDALLLVAQRASLMQQQPHGAMTAVMMTTSELTSLLDAELSLAAVNSPVHHVVSGPTEAIETLEQRLTERKVTYQRLHTSHAFHSPMMDGVLTAFRAAMEQIQWHAPTVPFISNRTGTWIQSSEATNPDYWVRHLRETVCFAQGVQQLMDDDAGLFLEVGPGRSLTGLIQACDRESAPARANDHSPPIFVSSMRHPKSNESDVMVLLKALGQMWVSGIGMDAIQFHAHQRRRRIPLPTYPFERQRYWIEPKQANSETWAGNGKPTRRTDPGDWLYMPVWKQAPPLALPARVATDSPTCFIVMADACGLANQLIPDLASHCDALFTVNAGDQFQVDRCRFVVDPNQRDHYEAVLREIARQGLTPTRVVHLWTVGSNESSDDLKSVNGLRVDSFSSLVFLAQALAKQKLESPLSVTIVSNDMQEITGLESLRPHAATLLGPCCVISEEHPNVTCRSVDVTLPAPGSAHERGLVRHLVKEVLADSIERVTAYRGNQRWIQSFERISLEARHDGGRLRPHGVYLITGGLGRIGLALAEQLARQVQAKLILISRQAFPSKPSWQEYLATHPNQDPTCVKIRLLLELERIGATVLVARADVSEMDSMRAAVELAKAAFGTIDGAFHAAGATDESVFRLIQDFQPADAEPHSRAKVQGTQVLSEILQDESLDFCMLISSISSMLGGLGFVAYSAVNQFLDAFARQQTRRTEVPWFSVNWDGWDFEKGRKQPAVPTDATHDLTIKPDEGQDLFRRLLASELPVQLIVSTGDLNDRVARIIRPRPARGADTRVVQDASPLHSRPAMEHPFQAPTNETEQSLANLWQQAFGIDRIGIHDNFFALGGDSLMAIGMANAIRDQFQIEFTMRQLLEAPSIAELGQAILHAMIASQDASKLDSILAELEEQAGRAAG